MYLIYFLGSEVLVLAWKLQENLKRLDLSLKDFTDIITKMGFEADKIQKKTKKNTEKTVT